MQSQLSKQKVGKACWNVLQGGEENADLTDGANDDIRCKGANTHNGGKGCVKGLLILQSAAVGSCIIKRHPAHVSNSGPAGYGRRRPSLAVEKQGMRVGAGRPD